MHYNSTCETLPQPFEYRVTLSEGRELPSCFYYEPILKQVSIKALSKFHAGDYLIMVDYFYSNLWYNKQGYVNVSIIANFYPPRFKESLPQLLYIYQNKLTYFNLPSLVDFDGDNSLIDEVKFSNGAAEFIGFYSTQGRLKFSPTLITALGLHKVTLKLCDGNKHQLCKKEVLKVQVVPPKPQEVQENKNSSKHKGIEREIRCKAITIDTLGVVRIGFSEEITLQNSDIDIKIVKDDVEYPLKFKFTKQTGTRIMLQLTNLEEFYPISPFQNQDLIKITFNKNLTTKYQNQERAGIIEKTVLYKMIPMQIESEPERAIFEQLQKIGPPIFFSVTSISFAGALIAQTSMSSFWGMINILQLITIQSLMSINIPGLPRSVNVVLLQMANADLIPYSVLTEQLFAHDEMDNESVNEFFEQGGFESTQSVLNLGSSFIYQAISIPLFLVTLLIAKFHCPKQVCQRPGVTSYPWREARSYNFGLNACLFTPLAPSSGACPLAADPFPKRRQPGPEGCYLSHYILKVLVNIRNTCQDRTSSLELGDYTIFRSVPRVYLSKLSNFNLFVGIAEASGALGTEQINVCTANSRNQVLCRSVPIKLHMIANGKT